MQNIYGIGPVLFEKIETLIRKQGVNPEGKDEQQIRKILKRREIFTTLPILTKIDLLYEPCKEIPRDVIHVINNELRLSIKRTKFDIAGSYRRNKPISRDVDLVICAESKEIHKIINSVNTSSILKIYQPFAGGENRISTIFEVKIPTELKFNQDLENIDSVIVKVDIFLCKPEEYMYTLLTATGSGDFNIRMRSVAKNKGYLLNQKGLYKLGLGPKSEKVDITSEKELFEFLDIKYLPPESRIK